MRIVVAAVGRLKAGAERELAERYRERAAKTGRALGSQIADQGNGQGFHGRDTPARGRS